jgi:hypothetical protein
MKRAISGGLFSVDLVANFFVLSDEFLPLSLGPRCLELPIFDCRPTVEGVVTPLFLSARHGGAITNRQSSRGWLRNRPYDKKHPPPPKNPKNFLTAHLINARFSIIT